jgi:methyltransferase
VLELLPVARWIPLAIVGLMIAERIAELFISERNRKALVARGGFEAGASHYPLMVGMHVLWIGAVTAWVVFAPSQINVALAVIYALVQVLRIWVMTTLGRYWTTRIITVPDAPLVARGPYRFLRHPNYVVVVIELAIMPLMFGAWHIAAAFTILNAIVLWIRISAENSALAPRRS